MYGNWLTALWIPAFAGMTPGTALASPHNVKFATIVIPAKAGIQTDDTYFREAL